MRILIADDRAIVRRGVRLILAESGRLMEIQETASSEETLEKIQKETWDVLILAGFPGETGLALLRRVKALRSSLVVLMINMHADEQFGIRALRSGANGYLSRESAPDELVRAVSKVASGGRYVTPTIAEALAVEVSGGTVDAPHRLLSDREFEVLRLIAQGKTPAQIATQLKVSTKTVSTYRSRIKEKMGFANNAEIIRYAIVHRLS